MRTLFRKLAVVAVAIAGMLLFRATSSTIARADCPNDPSGGASSPSGGTTDPGTTGVTDQDEVT
jgi:hypothetical protein